MSIKKTTIGGQAIIEGIVMKGPKKTCTVVRKAGGELVTKTEDAHHPSAFWRLPVLRGAYTLFTAMKDGIVAINYSAEFFEDEEIEEEPIQLRGETKTCPVCKAEVDGDALFCNHCGAQL